VLDSIERLLENPEEINFSAPLEVPDGSPIGMRDWMEFCSMDD